MTAGALSRTTRQQLAAWGRLLRIALFPTALADAAAGVVLGAGRWPSGPAPLLLAAGSLCVYHGALALNDWADRHVDRRARPERPLPSGALRPDAALAVAVALLALGLACSGGAAVALGSPPLALASAAALAVAALLAVAYDLGPRGPNLGPALVASCRGLDLGAGVLLGAACAGELGGLALGAAAALLYGLYVHQVSRLGRLEDLEDAPGGELGLRPARRLRLIAAALLAIGLLGVLAPFVRGRPPGPADLMPLLLAGAGALGLLRLARRPAWTPPDVIAAMGATLRRLLVFTASCALLAGTLDGAVVAAAILLGHPLGYWLRRSFPPS